MLDKKLKWGNSWRQRKFGGEREWPSGNTCACQGRRTRAWLHFRPHSDTWKLGRKLIPQVAPLKRCLQDKELAIVRPFIRTCNVTPFTCTASADLRQVLGRQDCLQFSPQIMTDSHLPKQLAALLLALLWGLAPWHEVDWLMNVGRKKGQRTMWAFCKIVYVF